MALVQVNSQQSPNLTLCLSCTNQSHKEVLDTFSLYIFFIMPFHHGFPGKMKQLTPKGRDAQEEGGCCGGKGQVDIPCELAQPRPQHPHQIPTER